MYRVLSITEKGAILFDNFDDPEKIKFIQSRDIGIIETDDYDNLESIQVKFIEEQIDKKDLVYLFNPVISSQVHNAGPYGIPLILPCLDSSRVIRKIHQKDLEILATKCYAGAFVLSVANQGTTEDQKKDEYSSIVKKFKPASSSVLLEHPDDTRLDQINWHPEFEGLLNTSTHLIKYIISCLNLPISIFDESIANKASLLGKVQLTLKVGVVPVRELLARMICKQFFQRHVDRLHPELKNKIRIKLHFEDIALATHLDLIKAALAVDSRQQLNQKSFGELSGLEAYANMVLDDKPITPGGGNTELPDDDGGNKEEEA